MEKISGIIMIKIKHNHEHPTNHGSDNGDQQIRIKEADNFSAANSDDIDIVFTTIQGLHTRLNSSNQIAQASARALIV